MGVFRNFPYSNFHEMNMDEIIKIVKNMLEEWAQYYAEWDAWMNQMNDDWSNYQEVMNTAWQNMQNFINNYFDNLNVQTEINNKINNMVRTGEFSNIVAPYIPPRVTEWLTAHITQPEGVVIDTSLSVSGACADAKATGDAINELRIDLKSDLAMLNDDLSEQIHYNIDYFNGYANRFYPVAGGASGYNPRYVSSKSFIEVTEGDALLITNIPSGFDNFYLLFYDDNDTLVRYYTTADITSLNYVVPTNSTQLMFEMSYDNDTPSSSVDPLNFFINPGKTSREIVDDLSTRLDTVVTTNLMGGDANTLYPVQISAGESFTISTSDGSIFDSSSTLQIRTYDANKVQTHWYGLNIGASYRTITTNDDIYYLGWNEAPITPLMVNYGKTKEPYQEYFAPLREQISTANANEIKNTNAQLQFNATGLYPLSMKWEQGGLGTSTGNEYNTPNAIRTDFIDLLEANYLTATFNATGSFGQWKMFFYTEAKSFISPMSYFTTNGKFVQTIPASAKYVRLHIEYWTDPLTPSDGAWVEYLGVSYNKGSDIPDYFRNNLDTAEETIRNLEADCSFNGDALVFLTDTHYSAEYLIEDDISSNAINANHSIPLVLDVIKNTGVRFIAFGGDLLNSCDGVDRMMHSISIFNDKFECNKFRLMSIVGNHEYYTDLNDETLGRPTVSQLYGGLIKINEDVILGRDAFNDYYFDNPIQKIRYFMISCGRDTELNNAQAEWFMDELTKVPNGYNIIVIGHAFILDDMSAFRDQHLDMMKALDAVTARTSYTFNGNTYDYSALQNVTVICVLTGHTHKDGYLLSPGGTLCICSTCDSYARQGGGITRTKGTVDEQAFDVVQFDFDNRKIYCTRIGYGSDREFTY